MASQCYARRRYAGSACKGVTSQGSTCQISDAYSWIVRSEENFPARATFMIAFRAQASRLFVGRVDAFLCPDVIAKIGQKHIAIAVVQQRTD